MIYLDYAATTPMREDVLTVFHTMAKKYFANPSSLHDLGTEADKALTLCREQIVSALHGKGTGVYFTSGGSEANVLAIRSLLAGNKRKGNHIITSKVEHASLYHLFEQLELEGYEVTFIGVDELGRVRLDELKQAIRKDTVLASIQHANSETGVIHPLQEIGDILEAEDVIFHSDAVQTFGKIQVDVTRCKMDSVSVASHKIYGPKGTGACYIRPSVEWKGLYYKATHEHGFRIGTVDVPSVISFTAAVQMAHQEMEQEQARVKQLRMRFKEKITSLNKRVIIQEHPEAQLPNIIGMTCRHVQGQHIMLECNRYGVAISTGSACQVGQQNPSRMMLAMGKTTEEANSFVRLSFGLMTTEEEIDEVCAVLKEIMVHI